jgi:hypothetical protein
MAFEEVEHEIGHDYSTIAKEALDEALIDDIVTPPRNATAGDLMLATHLMLAGAVVARSRRAASATSGVQGADVPRMR